jgi:hypothetical protein
MYISPTAEVPVKAAQGVPTLEALETCLRKQMFEPGAPEHLSESAVRADAHAVARMRCPGCNRRRLEFYPWQRGRQYRVLAGCAECGCGEEV